MKLALKRLFVFQKINVSLFISCLALIVSVLSLWTQRESYLLEYKKSELETAIFYNGELTADGREIALTAKDSKMIMGGETISTEYIQEIGGSLKTSLAPGNNNITLEDVKKVLDYRVKNNFEKTVEQLEPLDPGIGFGFSDYLILIIDSNYIAKGKKERM